MTDHIFGEGSYIEADLVTVVSVTPYDAYEPKFRPEHVCYCGAECVQLARVGFTTYQEDPDDFEGMWPRQISQNVKVHRCDEHKFEEPNDGN